MSSASLSTSSSESIAHCVTSNSLKATRKPGHFFSIIFQTNPDLKTHFAISSKKSESDSSLYPLVLDRGSSKCINVASPPVLSAALFIMESNFLKILGNADSSSYQSLIEVYRLEFFWNGLVESFSLGVLRCRGHPYEKS